MVYLTLLFSKRPIAGSRGDERASHDALLPTMLSLFARHVTFHSGMGTACVEYSLVSPN